MAEALEQTAAIRLLLYLLKNKEATITSLKNNLDASQPAIYNAIEKLLKAGSVSYTHLTLPTN